MEPNKKNVILVIDDEEEILALLSRMLRKRGYFVYTAKNIAEGASLVEEISPALMFLDVNLPDGNGLNKLNELKEMMPTGKIFMMSAFDSPENKEKARIGGASGFLSKPFSIDKINKILR